MPQLIFSAPKTLFKLMQISYILQNLMNAHLSRLQQDLYHELKKVCTYWCVEMSFTCVPFDFQNGTSRSLCIALDCYSSLFPLTRPAKCSSHAQALLPILVRLTSRNEEAIHEALQDAMSKILPTMTPFVTSANIQVSTCSSCVCTGICRKY